MITENVKAAIVAAINDGKLSGEEPLRLDSLIVFRMRSKAHEGAKGLRPAGNFDYKDEEYAVYFNTTLA